YLIQCVQFLLLFWWCTQYLIQCVQFLLHFWWCTLYKIQCSSCAVSNTVQAVYTLSNTVCTVSSTLLCRGCTQYLIQRVLFLLHFWWCTQYKIQCSHCTVSNTVQAMYTVSNTVCTVSNTLQASTAGGRGARLSFFSAAGRVIEPQHAEELVEWITKPSSSFSSSVTQAQSSLPSNAAGKAAYSTSSLSTVTPSIAPPSCTEKSPKLFNHSVRYMLLEDAQRFEGSHVGSQVEEESNLSLERGGATEGQETGSHVPPAAAYCQVCSSEEEGGDDEVTGCTWVPERREEEEGGGGTTPTRQDVV
ncbi:hypothetical protein AB205_0099950, partial [Aquarana catesbeiana]